MPSIQQTHVEVYVFRREGRRVEFLCMRRCARGSLPGTWQPVTGKRRAGERAVAAARREVFEETGLRPLRLWALETVTIYFDPAADVVRLLPLFAAEIGRRDTVALSREHDAFRFLGARAAGNRFLWEAQRRGLEAVRREVLARPMLARALEVPRAARHLTRTRPE
jgi:dATP pyrophosphohydrolase